MKKNIGFVSTRFSGTDGVSLEASKWAESIEAHGHNIFWFAGKLNRNPENSLWVPEAHFKHEINESINHLIFGTRVRSTYITDQIHSLKSFLKEKLKEFIHVFNIDMLIIENALTIPLHVPLGIAITEILAETQIPTIAHHHDFYWERTRFMVNAVGDFINMAFPPKLPSIEHVVINTVAQEELAHRLGISSIIIPNVLDFENPPQVDRERSLRLRAAIGITPEDFMILQPTRIIQRKGIEHAIQFVKALKHPRFKLFISHESGDEGFDYEEWIKEMAKNQGVDLRIMNTSIEDPWNNRNSGEGRFSLWDVYPHADFITFPSLYEGFGNAFLEAIYFRKPMLINRYATFVTDIEPKGFDLIVMDQYLKRQTIDRAKEVIDNPDIRTKMVEKNYQMALRHFSYKVLWNHLSYLITKIFGVRV